MAWEHAAWRAGDCAPIERERARERERQEWHGHAAWRAGDCAPIERERERERERQEWHGSTPRGARETVSGAEPEVLNLKSARELTFLSLYFLTQETVALMP